MSTRSRFEGAIAGVGTTSGIRIVVGRWARGPWGPFADVMLETAVGHRVLLAPSEQVREFVSGTYFFDETRVGPVTVAVDGSAWSIRAPGLELAFTVGARLPLGWALRAVPPPLATRPWWCALTDPIARVALAGVRTRGTAQDGRREWYAATDARRVTAVSGSFDGLPFGSLAPVDPPCRFGFSSTPRTPSVTSVVTTVEW